MSGNALLVGAFVLGVVAMGAVGVYLNGEPQVNADAICEKQLGSERWNATEVSVNIETQQASITCVNGGDVEHITAPIKVTHYV